MTKPQEKRIAVRFTEKDFWLWEDLRESAHRSGWDVSKQIRAELAAARGRAVMPILPDGLNSRFKAPSHGSHGKKVRKGHEAA